MFRLAVEGMDRDGTSAEVQTDVSAYESHSADPNYYSRYRDGNVGASYQVGTTTITSTTSNTSTTSSDDCTRQSIYTARKLRPLMHLNINNLLMQLRKLCNHPYLVLEDIRSVPDDLYFKHLVNSSGKLFVLDKLLWRLLPQGHKVTQCTLLCHAVLVGQQAYM